ncbi:hypothetical protein METSCH_B03830 [Metschnikowia aff. pulcherrima]|uniref:Uncharacterized protein n=1 Tax=Metschnikowia aff. pulcherrima TaxID=2163413 RepID=A0A4P6XNE3_9ASCO|nr:hypothetical protein METSCH_B03830 [Metschnikowia aff. pulcherrima]
MGKIILFTFSYMRLSQFVHTYAVISSLVLELLGADQADVKPVIRKGRLNTLVRRECLTPFALLDPPVSDFNPGDEHGDYLATISSDADACMRELFDQSGYGALRTRIYDDDDVSFEKCRSAYDGGMRTVRKLVRDFEQDRDGVISLINQNNAATPENVCRYRDLQFWLSLHTINFLKLDYTFWVALDLIAEVLEAESPQNLDTTIQLLITEIREYEKVLVEQMSEAQSMESVKNVIQPSHII